MAENEAGPDGFEYTVVNKLVLFYVNDVLLYSTNLVWPQCIFNVIIGIFEWVGIITNVEKMMVMICKPGTITKRHSDVSYGCQITGEGDPHCVKQIQRLVCW